MRKGVMLTFIKVFIILFYSRERKALFEVCKKGGPHYVITLKSTWLLYEMKKALLL